MGSTVDQQIWLGKLLKKGLLLLIFVVVYFLYSSTLQKDIGFWDAAEMQTVGYTFDIAHPTGYPTYIIATKTLHIVFFWITPVALRANFFSLTYTVLGLVFFYKNLLFLSKNQLVASFGTLAMSVHKDLWQVTTYADVFSLHFLFLNLVLYTYLTYNVNKTRNNSFSLALGFSLGNHMTSVFFLPFLGGIIYRLIKHRRYKRLIVQLSVVFVTVVLLYSSLWAISILKGQFTSDTDLSKPIELFRYITGSDFAANKQFFLRIITASNYNSFITNFSNHFPSGVIPIFLISALIGIVVKPLVFVPIIMAALFNTNFTLNYQNGYLDRYYIVSISIATLVVSSIVVTAKGKLKKLVGVILALLFLTVFIKNVSINYRGKVQSRHFTSRGWVNNVFNSIQPHGVVFSWWSYSTPMWYMQKVENVRPDITIINAGQGEWEKEAEAYLDKHPVYFIENIVTQKYRLSPVGNIYKLENHR